MTSDEQFTTWEDEDKRVTCLPPWLSDKDSAVNRLVAFYSALVWDRYGVVPEISNWGQTGKLLKKLLDNHTEVQVAAVMYVFFYLDDDFLRRNHYPINLLPRSFTEAKITLVDEIGKKFHDDVQLKTWLKTQLLSQLKSYVKFYNESKKSDN